MCAAAFCQEVASEFVPPKELTPSVSQENGIVDAVALIEDAGDDEKALQLIDSLRTLYPDNDALHYYAGVCEYSLRKPTEAIESFRKACELDSLNLAYKEALAASYGAIGDGEHAGEIYLELTQKDPRKYRNAYTLTLIADAYRMKRDFPRYFETLEEFARDESVNPEAKYKYLLSAVSRFDPKTFETITPRILQLCDVFTQTHPASYDAHKLKMQICAATEDYSGVIEEAGKMASLTGDPAERSEMFGLIGDMWHNLGNERKTFSYYESALKLNPKNSSVLNNWAWHLCSGKNGRKASKSALKKALQMAQQAVEQDPDNATMLDTLGWILYLQGKPQEAKPYFKHAMLYGGKDSATVLRHYAEVLKALGDEDLSQYYRGLADSKKAD